jgi:hypothetical protein
MAKTGSKKQPAKASAATGRARKLTKKQSKKKVKAKTKVRNSKHVMSSFKLTARVLDILRTNWRVLGGIVLVYLFLNIVFASGLSNLSGTVNNIKSNLSGNNQALGNAATGFSTLVASAGSSGSSTGSSLQGILFIIESLVIIWALRHLLAGSTIRVKQAYYQSMFPLIPFILVIFVIFLQLLPITIGATILAALISSAIINAAWASIISLILFIPLASWSIYMTCSSVFALYIVTLPDMQPRQALRSAKDLVSFRRWVVTRRILFLPVLILVVMAVIVIPLIITLPAIVPLVFYALSMVAILFVHTYLYSLYRELLA